MVVHISLSEDDVGETVCSLNFAKRARSIESNREIPEVSIQMEFVQCCPFIFLLIKQTMGASPAVFFFSKKVYKWNEQFLPPWQKFYYILFCQKKFYYI
jgi:hypothetical protein